METLTEDQIIARYSANLLNAQEASDGWMQAYYQQTARLLRAESALRDVVEKALEGIHPKRQAILDIASIALEEIKQ